MHFYSHSVAAGSMRSRLPAAGVRLSGKLPQPIRSGRPVVESQNRSTGRFPSSAYQNEHICNEIPPFLGNGGFFCLIWSVRRTIHRPPTVIPSRKAAHPRVASLAPAGQFTFWESPATYVRRFYRESATALTGFAMTVIVVGWCFCLGWAVIRPGLR